MDTRKLIRNWNKKLDNQKRSFWT